mgnify:CR=1 FL=1
MLWDRGTWVPKEDPVAGYAKGHLKFELDGENLKGGWTLVRTRGSKYGGKTGDKAWLLIKENDEYARPGAPSIVDDRAEQRHDRTEPRGNRRGAHARLAIEVVGEGKRGGRRDRQDQTRRRQNAAARQKRRRTDVKGAKPAKSPAMLSPMLTTLVASAPTGPDWLHEIKYDGYRMLCRIESGKARLVSRNAQGLDGRLRRHRGRPREAAGAHGVDRRRGGGARRARAAPAFRRCRMR